MNKSEIVEILVEVAGRAGMELDAIHPEDIGYAMMNAVEYGATTLDVVSKR